MTLVPFAPNSNNAPPFSAIVTLDGSPYTLVAMWGLYRGEWYVSLYDGSGNLVKNQPLIGSPPYADLPLFPGMFKTSTIVYRVATSNFEITP